MWRFRLCFCVQLLRRSGWALTFTAAGWASPSCADGAGNSVVGEATQLTFHLDDASLPDPSRTPGEADRSVKADTLCQIEEKQPPLPSLPLCEGAFSDFRIPEDRRYQYACAFVISPAIGGARTKKNVWLQPGEEAAVKRTLDREMRKRVCEKQISLMQAQKEVAEDWPGAYRRLVAGDVAVETYAPPIDEINGHRRPQSDVSSNLPDKPLMPADFAQSQSTGTPIEASVSIGTNQSGPQSGNQQTHDQRGHTRAAEPNVRSSGSMPHSPVATVPHRALTRQAGR